MDMSRCCWTRERADAAGLVPLGMENGVAFSFHPRCLVFVRMMMTIMMIYVDMTPPG